MLKFDWYQATIKVDPQIVFDTVAKLGDHIEQNDKIARMYRYQQGFDVTAAGLPVAHVIVGRETGREIDYSHAHAWATSADAPAFADLCRNEWPDSHIVTRVDSCEDFIDATAFQRLRKVGRSIARRHGLKFPRIEDSLNPTAGRTQYIGSGKSENRVTIYEKGWEIVNRATVGQHVIKAADFDQITVPGLDRRCHPSELVRLELRSRPDGEEARKAASKASPSDVWTFSEWTRQLASEALALDLERFYLRHRKITSDDRSLRFMCSQYGNLLERLRHDLGDSECVGRQIFAVIDELKAERDTHYRRPAQS